MATPSRDSGSNPTPFDEGIYLELRQQASDLLRRRGRANDPGTISLVNDVFVRVLQADERGALPSFDSEREILCYLSRSMRNHLVSLSRKQLADKRLDEQQRIPWQESAVFPATQQGPGHLLDVHLAMEELAQDNPEIAEILELMFFWGCTRAELAQAFGCTEDQIRGKWNFARAWLRQRLSKLDSD